MSWLLGKKNKKLNEDKWMIKQGQKDGLQLFVRIRNSKPNRINTNDYPHLIGISWEYKPRDESGLPDSSVLNEMGRLEELLDKIESNNVAYLMAIITGNGTREWLWYSRDASEMMSQVNEALASQQPFPIKFIREDDPTWSAYDHWLNA